METIISQLAAERFFVKAIALSNQVIPTLKNSNHNYWYKKLVVAPQSFVSLYQTHPTIILLRFYTGLAFPYP
ncbi:hypothetical protein JYQ62_10215 [Nostoc sp. UHCC 0702]|nr:hypothetical protein JYQ62_10215 [Nostoc sp. UHCC 0702]